MTNKTRINTASALSGFVAVAAAVFVFVSSCIPVHALGYITDVNENGDGMIYDEENGCYVSLDAGQDTAKVFVAGAGLTDENRAGEGWSYDAESNALTLDSFSYEGTGLFASTSSDDESDAEDGSDEEDEEYSDEEWEDEEYYDEEWEDEEYYEEYEDEEYADAEDEEGAEEETAEPVKGVIRSEGDLTLSLKGESRITITDEGSDEGYAINVAGELKVEGGGVLYIRTAAGEKVYGNVPEEEDPAAGNSGNINNNTNTNDIVNEQTVNEAPVTQTMDDGDVSVNNSNDIDMPDISNNISLPDIANTIDFDPVIEVKLPESSSERIIVSGFQRRYPETVNGSDMPMGRCGADGTGSRPEGRAPVVRTSEGRTSAASPKTADSMDLGVLMALIATLVIGGTAGGIMLRQRFLERRRSQLPVD